MTKFINKNAYELLLREVINSAAAEICNIKIQIPYPINRPFGTGWLPSAKSKDIQVCFIADSLFAIFPYMMMKTGDLLFANRCTSIVDYESLKFNEPRIFNFFARPLFQYCLNVYDTISEKEVKELEKILQAAHKKKFKTTIKKLEIERVPVPPAKTDEEVEYEVQFDKKNSKK